MNEANKIEKEKLENAISNSLSIAETCRQLNIRPSGGNYKTINRKIKLWNIDISHFTGQAWNQGTRFKKFCVEYKLEDILVENSTFVSSYGLKLKLFNNNIKDKKCEKCLLEKWNELPIPTELNHINGNSSDNRIENLVILSNSEHQKLELKHRKNVISSS